jgi:hypothetical protein
MRGARAKATCSPAGFRDPSTMHGARRRCIPRQTVCCIDAWGAPALYPAADGVLYHVRYPTGQDSAKTALYRQANPSAPWTVLPDSVRGFPVLPTPTTLAFRYAGPSIMYLGTRRGVWLSGNGGNSWSAPSGGRAIDSSIITALAAHPARADLAWAAARSGAAAANHLLFLTSTAGTEWRAVLSDTLIRCFAVPARDTASLLVATQRRILATVDGGRSWNDVTGDLPLDDAYGSVQRLHVDPASSVAYVATWRGVYASDAWIPTAAPEPGTPATLTLTLFPQPCRSGEDVALRWTLPSDGGARLEAVDLLGRRVALPVDGSFNGGEHLTILPASVTSRAPGVLFLLLTTPHARLLRRLVILPR